MNDNSNTSASVRKNGDGIKPAESSPPWEVLERLQNALGKHKESFGDWAGCQGRTAFLKTDVDMTSDNDDDLFFIDDVLRVLPHVTLPAGFRLAATVQSCWGDPCAEFVAAREGHRLPLDIALCPDGTPESYWEAVALWFEANQFYRFGHANYQSMKMVPDLGCFLRNYCFCGFTGEAIYNELPQASRRKLSQMDFGVEVNPASDGCEVRFTTFAPFGGFSRIHMAVRKGKMGMALFPQVVEMIPYHCPIMF